MTPALRILSAALCFAGAGVLAVIGWQLLRRWADGILPTTWDNGEPEDDTGRKPQGED